MKDGRRDFHEVKSKMRICCWFRQDKGFSSDSGCQQGSTVTTTPEQIKATIELRSGVGPFELRVRIAERPDSVERLDVVTGLEEDFRNQLGDWTSKGRRSLSKLVTVGHKESRFS